MPRAWAAATTPVRQQAPQCRRLVE
ncbi:hypothetical protein [Mycobacterium sp. E2497]